MVRCVSTPEVFRELSSHAPTRVRESDYDPQPKRRRSRKFEYKTKQIARPFVPERVEIGTDITES